MCSQMGSKRSLVVGPWGDSTVEQLDHISTSILVLMPSRLFLFFKMVCGRGVSSGS